MELSSSVKRIHEEIKEQKNIINRNRYDTIGNLKLVNGGAFLPDLTLVPGEYSNKSKFVH